MTTQRELGRLFRQGATSGSASNVEIQDAENTTRLVGYGHAVYAIRFKSTGKVVGFGWRGYSMSTSCQLTKLGIKRGDPDVDRCDDHIDVRASLRRNLSNPFVEEYETEEVSAL